MTAPKLIIIYSCCTCFQLQCFVCGWDHSQYMTEQVNCTESCAAISAGVSRHTHVQLNPDCKITEQAMTCSHPVNTEHRQPSHGSWTKLVIENCSHPSIQSLVIQPPTEFNQFACADCLRVLPITHVKHGGLAHCKTADSLVEPLHTHTQSKGPIHFRTLKPCLLIVNLKIKLWLKYVQVSNAHHLIPSDQTNL